jgi:serine/threonine protein phosphatase PrpC
MPPYLNGEPVAMEGALPLGMMEGAEFSVMRFKLAQGDRLVLVSDGIAEATDADGQLFGFERVHELLRTGKSASEVAGAAQSFGQEDDISVIAVTRTAVLEPALAFEEIGPQNRGKIPSLQNAQENSSQQTGQE